MKIPVNIFGDESAERRREADKAAALIELKRESVVLLYIPVQTIQQYFQYYCKTR